MRNPLPTWARFLLYIVGALLDLGVAWGLGKELLDGFDAAFLVGVSGLLHLLAAAKTIPVFSGPDIHDEP